MNEIFAYRLKNARIHRGISVKQLIEKLGVSKQMISKYEKGLSVPDAKKLIALANILGVKPNYFFTPSNVVLKDIKFRKKAKTSKKKVDSIKVSILNKMENYLLIEDILSIKSDFTMPLNNNIINSVDDVEPLAAELRQKWNIGNDPINNIISLLESNEIKVIEINDELTNSFDGLSTFVNDRFPAIVVNKKYGIERKRFTLLHELGHLLLSFNDNIDDKEQEKICDHFAGAVLLPKEILLEEVGRYRTQISLNELINLQRRFGISISAIMYRMVSLSIIPKSKIKSFYKRINSQPSLKALVNEERFLGDEKSGRYNRLVYKALSQEIISISKASALLGLDIKTIENKLTIL